MNTVNVNTGRIYTYLRVNTARRSRKYQACDAQPGSRNDKVGVKGDAFVKAVREDSLYTEFEFNLEGTTQTQRGALILCDGGYCR